MKEQKIAKICKAHGMKTGVKIIKNNFQVK